MELKPHEYFYAGYLSAIAGIYFEEIQIYSFAKSYENKEPSASKVTAVLEDRLNAHGQTTANNMAYVNHLYEQLGFGKLEIPKRLSEYSKWQNTNFNKTRESLENMGLNAYLLAYGSYLGTLEKCSTILLSTVYLPVATDGAIWPPSGIIAKSLDALKEYEEHIAVTTKVLMTEEGFDFVEPLAKTINEQIQAVLAIGVPEGGPMIGTKDPKQLFDVTNTAVAELTEVAKTLSLQLETKYSDKPNNDRDLGIIGG
ncbi:MAG: hypothetical protein GY810_28345 [Aureispira sp.]|nr:hypothetical protein [Aureispira sp.]